MAAGCSGKATASVGISLRETLADERRGPAAAVGVSLRETLERSDPAAAVDVSLRETLERSDLAAAKLKFLSTYDAADQDAPVIHPAGGAEQVFWKRSEGEMLRVFFTGKRDKQLVYQEWPGGGGTNTATGPDFHYPPWTSLHRLPDDAELWYFRMQGPSQGPALIRIST
jgi:hypothetical protein